MSDKIRKSFAYVKWQMNDNSCESLFWLINIMPIIGGFSYKHNMKNHRAMFWCIHFGLSIYVYIIGTIVYNKYYAKEITDFVNSFFNVSILILILNNTLWTIFKRSDLLAILEKVKENDDLVKKSQRFRQEHRAVLKKIKLFILACYSFHFVNDILIFITSRILDTNDLEVASCTGLDPLSGSPNIEICKAVIILQELTCIVVVGGFDVMLIFLITHTTAMFKLLHLETEDLATIVGNREERSLVAKRLKDIIDRHAKVLKTSQQLQDIYTAAIGVDFWNNGMSACLFFVLPLDVCLNFAPIVAHNLIVFFIYCLLGQRLSTASQNIEIALYNCGWQNFGLKEKKAIVFMIKQSQKPVRLLAARIVPIQIYTFANTMQMIYKFVTVFKI